MAEAFGGAKIAVVVDGRVLVMLRDDRPDIPHPGLWDLPGGGREGAETPLDTALREVHEELGLRLDPVRIAARRAYPGRPVTWAFLAYWPGLDPGQVRFGDEGQAWRLMPVAEFLRAPDAIPALQRRLADLLGAAPRGLQR